MKVKAELEATGQQPAGYVLLDSEGLVQRLLVEDGSLLRVTIFHSDCVATRVISNCRDQKAELAKSYEPVFHGAELNIRIVL